MHVFFDKLHSNLAGLYVFVPDFGYCILVNSVHPKERRRWTIAHEYGHFLADRDRPIRAFDGLTTVGFAVPPEAAHYVTPAWSYRMMASFGPSEDFRNDIRRVP